MASIWVLKGFPSPAVHLFDAVNNPAGAPASLVIVVTHGCTVTVRDAPGGDGFLSVWLRFWSSGGAAMSVALGTLLGDCLHNARRLVTLPDERGRLIPHLEAYPKLTLKKYSPTAAR